MMSLQRLLKRFVRDERGVTLPMIGIAFTALVGSVGVAIDSGRAQLVQSKLSAALDAAGLAAGATVNTTNMTAEVNKYLHANFPTDYIGAEIKNIVVTVSDDKTTVDLSADAEVETTFMNIMGFDKVTVHAESQITRSNKGLELVMVLDNTGSMSGDMTSLRSAANEMVNILYGGRSTVDDLWIGLVPFSQAVNIGTSRSGWLDTTYGATLNWGPGSWGGCVDARWTGRDVTDDPPSVERFRAYYWQDDSNNDWIRSNGTYRTPLTTSRGPNKNCPNAVTPMTANKSTITAGINAMTAVGNTHINEGAAWGWRMISPRWRGLWGGEMDANSLPLDYNTPLMNKAVVIMTDGDNVMSSNVRSAYGYLSEGRLGSTSASVAEAALDAKLSTICTAMKNQNIFVYTIAFRNPGTTIRNLLQNCATQPDYYFNSSTTTDLQNAFRAIGDSLANLRVSK
jgi:Flp pilus assembly protein TadG